MFINNVVGIIILKYVMFWVKRSGFLVDIYLILQFDNIIICTQKNHNQDYQTVGIK